MKLPMTVALATIVAGCVSCIPESAPQHQTTKPAPLGSRPADAATAPTSWSKVGSPDSMLAVLTPLQGAVYADPKDAAGRAPLSLAAYDTSSGSFLVVGKGVANPSAATATVEPGRARAAESDAKRWSLYLKAWHTGDTRAFGAPIEGDVTYGKLLAQVDRGDTLYQLWQIPVGSVVVRGK